MPINRINFQKFANTALVSSVSVTMNGQKRRNLNLAFLLAYSGVAQSLVSISDTLNGAYTNAVPKDTQGNVQMWTYYANDIAAGNSTVTFTIGSSLSANNLVLLVYELGGQLISNPFNVSVSVKGNTGSLSPSLSLSPTIPACGLFDAFWSDFSVTGSTWSSQLNDIAVGEASDYNLVGATGTYTDTISFSGSGNWLMQGVAVVPDPGTIVTASSGGTTTLKDRASGEYEIAYSGLHERHQPR